MFGRDEFRVSAWDSLRAVLGSSEQRGPLYVSRPFAPAHRCLPVRAERYPAL